MIKDELEVVAKRFNLTKSQTIETIIHEIYVRGLNSEQFKFVFEYAETYDEPQDYSCDDDDEDEEDEFPELTEIKLQSQHLQYLIDMYMDSLKYPNQEPPF